MERNVQDSRLVEYKDTIGQLNRTIKSQNNLIESLRKILDANSEAMAGMQ